MERCFMRPAATRAVVSSTQDVVEGARWCHTDRNKLWKWDFLASASAWPESGP